LHPALHCWREELPAALVRFCAIVSGVSLMSLAAAQVFQSTAVIEPISQLHHSNWIAIEHPIPAFTLDIPEAAGAPSTYVIARHAEGGRKDILSLGTASSTAPYLQVEIYRPGHEVAGFAAPQEALARLAGEAGSLAAFRADEPLPSKFGPLSVAAFDLVTPEIRHCLGFVRDFGDPPLQLSGRFCEGGSYVARPTLACALDRLTLLSAAGEPKLAALFAQAERERHFCGHRDPIIAPTPKFEGLWQALATRPEPRRIGR
jgi:hypothetical protein